MTKTFSMEDFSKFYEIVTEAHKEYLGPLGVKLPKPLDAAGKPTKNALVLAILTKYINKEVSKLDLTRLVRIFHPQTTDVQQGRHLARQSGWNIVSGRRHDSGFEVSNDAYMLISLSTTYPTFRGSDGHRAGRTGLDFDSLKTSYGNRCATCGSLEGQPSFLNPGIPTILQEGHMDPTKPLDSGNTIPQCDECNRAYQDRYIFDGQGRVSDINITSFFWQKKYRKIGDKSGS
jgi:hypothetical protein